MPVIALFRADVAFVASMTTSLALVMTSSLAIVVVVMVGVVVTTSFATDMSSRLRVSSPDFTTSLTAHVTSNLAAIIIGVVFATCFTAHVSGRLAIVGSLVILDSSLSPDWSLCVSVPTDIATDDSSRVAGSLASASIVTFLRTDVAFAASVATSFALVMAGGLVVAGVERIAAVIGGVVVVLIVLVPVVGFFASFVANNRPVGVTNWAAGVASECYLSCRDEGKDGGECEGFHCL